MAGPGWSAASVAAVTLGLGWAVRHAAVGNTALHRWAPRGPLDPARFRRWSTRTSRTGRRGGPSHLGEVVALRSALLAGSSVPAAFDLVAGGDGPWADRSVVLARQLRAGVAMQAAVDAWAADDPAGARSLVADALAIATVTGGSQAAALDAVVSTLAERHALSREIRALSSQATASALVLIATPLVFAAVVAVADERVRRFYVASPAGPACLALGAVLDVGGAWWMARLLASVR